MGNGTNSEKEQIEYLFVDIEWNQPTGTADLGYREAIEIGIVAADARLNQVKTFSRMIRLKDPDTLNPHTVMITHMPKSNIMQGRTREEVMGIVRQCFPAYKYLVVWAKDTYDLFRRDMKECGIPMPKHRVVILQDVLGLITGNNDSQIQFEQALQCAEIEYKSNYLHYSRHDANYLYQLYTKLYRQYSKLTYADYCDTNVQTGKMHIAGCHYAEKARQEVILPKLKNSIFRGYTACRSCAHQIGWKQFEWDISTYTHSVQTADLKKLRLTEKNIEMLCKYFHMSYSICNGMIFVKTGFTRWIIYLQDGKVSKLLHENYKPSKSEYSKKQKKKCMEGYHKQKLPSQNLYEVLRYIDSHDSSMVKRMTKKSRLEQLFEQVKEKHENSSEHENDS